MFTGLVQTVGMVEKIDHNDSDARFSINLGKIQPEEIRVGDSIAVSGVCLTVTGFMDRCFQTDVSKETLSRTVLQQWRVGSPVNLELALTLSSRLGGHLVSGHVDGMGKLVHCSVEGESTKMSFSGPQKLAGYISEKGSICIDGVSLTVNTVRDQGSAESGFDGVEFDVNIVPQTLEVTTLGTYSSGQSVNLEVDQIARYLERLLIIRSS